MKKEKALSDSMLMSPWSLVFRGILALIFGLLLFLWPDATLVVVVILFALFAILDGLIILIMALIKGRNDDRWIHLVPIAIVGIILGIIVLLIPEVSILILIYLVAAWALITGFGEFILALAGRAVHGGMRWMYAITGIISVFLGILIFVYPVMTTTILIWIFGLYLIVSGVMVIILGFWSLGGHKK